MDKEYPDVIFHPAGDYSLLSPAEKYKLLKSNVDALNLIQLGITLSDADGNLPDLGTGNERFVWQFNFSDFDLRKDRHARDSIRLVIIHGINFEKNHVKGINSVDFAELMMSWGLVCNDSVSWVTFQGSYDVGYLLKILTRRQFRGGLKEFLELGYFLEIVNFYDVKHLMTFCNLYGGLNGLARVLDLNRLAGRAHQAGSNNLLMCHVFYKMRFVYFVNGGAERHAGVLHGFKV